MSTKWTIPPDIFHSACDRYREGGIRAALDYIRSFGIPITRAALQSRFQHADIHTNRGPNGAQPWSEDELETLTGWYPDLRVSRDRLLSLLPERTWAAIRTKASDLGLSREVPPSPLQQIVIPHLTVDRPVLVLADIHVPYHNAPWINRVLDLASAWGVEDCIAAGDAFDAHNLSRFERFDHPTVQEEIHAWEEVENAILSRVAHLHWFLGNHEARMARAIDFKIPLVEMVRNHFVRNHNQVSVYDAFCLVVNDCWWLEHPKSSSKNAALKICLQKQMNVAIAHTHHSSQVRDPSGQRFAVHIGASADHSRMPYCTRITHGSDVMTNGALILVPTEHGMMNHYLLEPEHDLERMQGMYSDEDWGDWVA